MNKVTLFAASVTKEQLEDQSIDVLELAMEAAMARLGWECLSNPHESFQWVGNELKERPDGGLNIYIKVVREDKENPEYDERTKKDE